LKQEEASKKEKEARQEEHIAWLVNNGVMCENILETDEAVAQTVEAIAGEKREEFGGMSLDDIMKDTRTSVYIGITKQSDVSKEALRFLTARGANRSGSSTSARNRPVLQWSRPTSRGHSFITH